MSTVVGGRGWCWGRGVGTWQCGGQMRVDGDWKLAREICYLLILLCLHNININQQNLGSDRETIIVYFCSGMNLI